MARVLKWVILAPLALFVGLAVIGSFLPKPPPSSPPIDRAALVARATERLDEMTANIKLNKFQWTQDRFGRVEISADVENANPKRLKDFEFTCEFYAKSGTLLNKLKSTLYEEWMGGEKSKLKSFYIGYVNTQAQRANCRVTSFAFVP